MDCDHFKYINDRYGHHKGNEVLRFVANNIQGDIRSIDMLARIGGDEFVILLPETGFEDAKIVLSRINKKLLKALQENKYPITVSIGAAIFNKPLDSNDEMVQVADKLMYLAKKDGGDSIKYEIFGSQTVSIQDDDVGKQTKADVNR